MSDELVSALIRRECIEIDKLVETCLKRSRRQDEFLKSGAEDVLSDSLATCLHSFYTGLEQVFEAVVRKIDGVRSVGPEWHRELLIAVSVEKPGIRPPVISERSYGYLENYRAFRHLFRHLYTHRIEPKRVFELIKNMETAWKLIRKDLDKFLDFLEK